MTKHEMDLALALQVLEQEGWYAERSDATRALLNPVAKLRHYVKDERIYLAGEPPDGIYGLAKGSLNVSYLRADGENFTAHRVGVGTWFGALAFLADRDRLTSVHAAEPCTIVHLPAKGLHQLTQEHPRLYADFYQITYENFQTSLRILSNLALPSTDKRLADRLLLDLDSRGDSDGRIEISQSELASVLAISVPTLQRVLRRFIKAGILHSSYGRIRVLDKAALAKICTERDVQTF